MSDETQEQTPQPIEQTGPEPQGPPPGEASAALKDDLAKERKQRQALERQASALQKQLEEFQTSQMSEQEKAIADAKAQTRAEVLAESGSRLAKAELRAALTGVVEDPAAVIDDLNLAKFVGDDGEPNAEAINDLKVKWLKLVPNSSTPKVPTGKRGDGKAITEDQLSRMSPQEISAAFDRGELTHLM